MVCRKLFRACEKENRSLFPVRQNSSMAQKSGSSPPMETPSDQSGTAPPPSRQVMGVGLADLCIKRPVFATMINLLLVVLGLFAYQRIGIDQLPHVELPIVTVTTTL